jgi:1-acyl-sn-glycerol-3-phosphate acyltransferase
MMRRLLARVFWATSGWTLVSQPPEGGGGILVGAPHTSSWDFLFMLAITGSHGVKARFLGKKSLFRGALGPIARALGGIPVDRGNPAGLVDDLVARVRAGEQFYLVITPEGTRSKQAYWKSGFYRIARDADLPVTLGFVDRSTRTAGLGLTLRITGDVHADMDRIRAFYADKVGINPAGWTPPRMSEEDKPDRTPS